MSIEVIITHILLLPAAPIHFSALERCALGHSRIAHYGSLFISIHILNDSPESSPSRIERARSSAIGEEPSVHRDARYPLLSLSGTVRNNVACPGARSANRSTEKHNMCRMKEQNIQKSPARRKYVVLVSTPGEKSIRRAARVLVIIRTSFRAQLATGSKAMPGTIALQGLFAECARICAKGCLFHQKLYCEVHGFVPSTDSLCNNRNYFLPS